MRKANFVDGTGATKIAMPKPTTKDTTTGFGMGANMAMGKAELKMWSLRYILNQHLAQGLSTNHIREMLAEAEAEVDKYDLLFYDIVGKD